MSIARLSLTTLVMIFLTSPAFAVGAFGTFAPGPSDNLFNKTGSVPDGGVYKSSTPGVNGGSFIGTIPLPSNLQIEERALESDNAPPVATQPAPVFYGVDAAGSGAP
jgi:hypothetical protein